MDAVEFLETAERRARTYPEYYDDHIRLLTNIPWPDYVAKIEEWGEKNPIKTNQSKFLEMFPETELERGHIAICPRRLFSSFPCPLKKDEFASCDACKDKYWLKEIE